MAYFTLGQAAKETGKQKSTILEAIRSGRLSATRDDKKQWQIEASELFRVYEAKPRTERHETPPNTNEHPLEIARMLEKEQEERARERRQLEGVIDDLRADRDHWRQQATALLTHQPDSAPEVVADAERAGFRLPPWAWLFVGAGLVAVTGAAFAWRHPEFFA